MYVYVYIHNTYSVQDLAEGLHPECVPKRSTCSRFGCLGVGMQVALQPHGARSACWHASSRLTFSCAWPEATALEMPSSCKSTALMLKEGVLKLRTRVGRRQRHCTKSGDGQRLAPPPHVTSSYTLCVCAGRPVCMASSLGLQPGGCQAASQRAVGESRVLKHFVAGYDGYVCCVGRM